MSASTKFHRQRGISLIEILVGMVIAMVGVIIMMEVLLGADQRTRTSNAGNDATSTGAVMLHMVKRDLVQAGYGINTQGLLGCNLTLPNGKVIPLAPVVINPAAALVPAGDANTDTLLVVYGSDNGQPEGNAVFSVDVAASSYAMQAPQAFSPLDYVIAYPGGCGAGLTLARIPAGGVTTLAVSVDAVTAGATIVYNMGQSPRVVAYAVRNGALTSCDYMVSDCSVNNATNWTAVAGNIVSLRAQYGKDTAAAGTWDGVDTWDQATPANACGWVRAPGIRLVMVARSSQYESRIDPVSGQRVGDPVTTAAPTWSGSAGAPIDLSANADWRFYRYKTFENMAPPRNVVWMGAQSGC
jgi:type IV pilus assembly protein PilW